MWLIFWTEVVDLLGLVASWSDPAALSDNVSNWTVAIKQFHVTALAKYNLLQDNARPHVAKKTKEKLTDLGWEHLDHPPYSPERLSLPISISDVDNTQNSGLWQMLNLLFSPQGDACQSLHLEGHRSAGIPFQSPLLWMKTETATTALENSHPSRRRPHQ
ncbi:hypothetical protein KIN20_028212 [Parelaphostrongylus tenuis]|uniref:Transposase n=1 Tax=Parelaphostrongylus tenuis TaxID=148309 RepID=A0AAD5R0E8_PARTN|nr:hypothetical protein KIN20_028212 [Parelaphostrongylus tenuis]